MEFPLRIGLQSGFNSSELTNPSALVRISKIHHFRSLSRKARTVSASRSPLPGSEFSRDDVLEIFLKERQLNGDLISKASDIVWQKDVLKFIDSEARMLDDHPQQSGEVAKSENDSGFLKLTRTKEWVSGDNVAPINKKRVIKELQNESERRKRLNLLKYEALKREMLLLTSGVGAACTGYCLIVLSIQAAVSYATGVLLSCLYLQLLCHHVDNLSKEAVPQIFMQKKSHRIGITSEDLKNLLERYTKGSIIALSSPRLVIPASIYGLWGLSLHYSNDFLDFQLVPTLLGMFAYKAAAIVQIYRDNEDLRIVFPEDEESY